MNKLTLRLLLFFIGFPVLISLIFFLPFLHHLALNVVIIAASAIGAWETSRFFSKKGYGEKPVLAAAMGAVLPLTAYLQIAGVVPEWTLPAVLILGASIILAVPALSQGTGGFSGLLFRVSSRLAVFLYPGLFLAYAVMLSSFSSASILIMLFIFAVYLNDSFAYSAGNLFGRSSRNIVTVSPNKSLAGFIVGFLTSVGVFIAGYYVFRDIFPGSVLKAVFMGSVIGFSTILGDLVESGMKRSAEVKDSGTIIPGRGGILDSVDSIIFSAPLFYYLYSILFTI